MNLKTKTHFKLSARLPFRATILCFFLAIQSLNSVFAEDLILNLQNAEIKTLINTVSELTGKNFIIDPRVKGKVTVVSAKPMDADGIYNVFLSILQVHGISAIEGDGIIKIVPDAGAKQHAIPFQSKNQKSTDRLITRVIKLKNIPATQVVPILRPLIPQHGHLVAYAPSNTLIISDRASNISRILQIIKRIDINDTQDIEVIRLEYASASETTRLLNSLTSSAQKNSGTQKTILADDRTNSILLSGPPAERLRLRAIISHLDTPLNDNESTHVVYLRYANATKISEILNNLEKAGKDSKTTQSYISADPETNSLIINADANDLSRFKSIIRQLDIRRAQVLIEAIIVEVSLDNAAELGVSFVGADSTRPGGGIISNFSSSSGSSLTDILVGSATFGSGITVGIGDLLGSSQFALLLRALQTDTSTNILSTPTIVTLDNEEAEIVVGKNVPFITGSFSNTGSGSSSPNNPFQTIERHDVGLTLRVTPHVNAGDSIHLEIENEISSISESSIASADLITNKRKIKTNVIADDGQVIVLGGLIEDTTRETISKVPFLGSIPGIGKLFSSKRSTKVKQNLMVFIRPTILKNGLSDIYTRSKYNFMRAQQMAVVKQANKSSISKSPDVLPELKEPKKKIKPDSSSIESIKTELDFLFLEDTF
ncbi:MAG: type II secretion system protein GspD [Gammaproteobacteria bacterium]|nr:type II secretion system protein GspD [Gammaproteobacteria bacterium]